MSFAPSEYAYQDIGNLFEPDALLPEQFYATLRKSHHSDPERRLIAAVLEDAVACLSLDPHNCSGRQRRAFHEARKWINDPHDSNWVFSFRSICEALGIEPGYLRKGLNLWTAKFSLQMGQASPSPTARVGVRHKQFRLRN